jgi:CRISPR/Cas system endoribonuclease Cas6 (RAMP superfamily)
MEKQYYCNNHWFTTYDKASFYADIMLELEGKYHVVYTKAEMDSITEVIDHEMECGK